MKEYVTHTEWRQSIAADHSWPRMESHVETQLERPAPCKQVAFCVFEAPGREFDFVCVFVTMRENRVFVCKLFLLYACHFLLCGSCAGVQVGMCVCVCVCVCLCANISCMCMRVRVYISRICQLYTCLCDLPEETLRLWMQPHRSCFHACNVLCVYIYILTESVSMHALCGDTQPYTCMYLLIYSLIQGACMHMWCVYAYHASV